MAASIGTLAYKLIADPTGFEAGIGRALKAVDKFASQVGKGLASVPNAIGKLISAPFDIVGHILGPLQQALSGIPVVGGLLAAIPMSGAGFIAFFKQGVERIQEMVGWSKRLHIGVEDIAGVMHLFGDSIGPVGHALAHFQAELGAAVGGSRAAQKHFEQLGVDWADLGHKAPIDQFRGLMKVISDIPDQTRRAHTGFELLGRLWFEVGPALEKGPAALDKALASSKFAGLSLTEGQVAGVLEFSKAMKDLHQIIEGVQSQLAAAAAPWLNALNAQIKELFGNSLDIPKVFAKIEGAVMNVIKVILNGLQKVVEEAKKLMEEIRGNTPKGMVADAAGGKGMLGKIFNPIAYDMNQAAAGGSAAPGERWGDMFEKSFNQSKQAWKDKYFSNPTGTDDDRFREQRTKVDQDLRAGPLDDYLHRIGDLNTWFEYGAKDADTFAKAIAKTNKEFAAALGVKLTMPLEDLREKVKWLDQALSLGKFTQQQHDMALGQLGEAFLKEGGSDEVKLPSFMTLGSQGFAELQAKMEAQGGGGSVQDRIAAAAEATNQKMDRYIEIAEAMEQRLALQKPVVFQQAQMFP